jgi:hypothetical protein
MIHTIYTMTIGRYGRLDGTQDARLLRRWWNPLPLGLFRKSIDKFFDAVRNALNEDGQDTGLTDQLERLYMVNKMLQLSILYDALYLLMIIKAGIDISMLLMDKTPAEAKNIDYYKARVKEMTGIDIIEMTDLGKLRDEMTRLADKFRERFSDNAEPEEKVSFYKGVLSVFSLMEMPYNERMNLAEFAELKKLADERRKQLEKQMEKYGTT